MKRFVLAALLMAIAWPAPSAALEISHVSHAPGSIEPIDGQRAVVRFRLSEPAHARVRIFDGRDLLIRELDSREAASGDHEIAWDGKDANGRPVPPEAYHYTILAEGDDGERVRWDLSDLTGGDPVPVENLSWDPDSGIISYHLREAARIHLRIRLQGEGPLMRILLDWVPRSAGLHRETWDGWDQSGVVDLARHPQLELAATTSALSRNTILIGPASSRVALIEDLPDPHIKRHRQERRLQALSYADQPIERRRAFPLELTLPETTETTEDGRVIVTGPIPVRLDLPATNARRAHDARFGVALFVDGKPVFENELGFLPMTWIWDPAPFSQGPYFITANLRSYEGHYGTATRRVAIDRPKE